MEISTFGGKFYLTRETAKPRNLRSKQDNSVANLHNSREVPPTRETAKPRLRQRDAHSEAGFKQIFVYVPAGVWEESKKRVKEWNQTLSSIAEEAIVESVHGRSSDDSHP